MFRRSCGRLGHQLIKEPLGNEVDTFARRRRTFHNVLHELQIYTAIAVVGSLLAINAMYKADPNAGGMTRVNAQGKVVGNM